MQIVKQRSTLFQSEILFDPQTGIPIPLKTIVLSPTLLVGMNLGPKSHDTRLQCS